MNLLGTGIILLNAGLKNSLPAAVYKWPLFAVFILGVLGVGTAVFAFMMRKQQEPYDDGRTVLE